MHRKQVINSAGSACGEFFRLKHCAVLTCVGLPPLYHQRKRFLSLAMHQSLCSFLLFFHERRKNKIAQHWKPVINSLCVLLNGSWKVMCLQRSEEHCSSELILAFHTKCEIELFEELWRLACGKKKCEESFSFWKTYFSVPKSSGASVILNTKALCVPKALTYCTCHFGRYHRFKNYFSPAALVHRGWKISSPLTASCSQL